MIHARIFKANDIRGVATGPDPEWDAAGAYAIGAATADVFGISGGSGALVVGRDMRTTSPELVRGLHRRGAEPWRRRGRHRAGQHRRAVVRLGFARPAGRDVHRQPQSRQLQRDQVLPPGGPARRAGGAGGHPRARPGGRPPGPDAGAPAVRPGTRTERDLLGAYADHLLSLVDLSGIRRLKVVVDAGNGMGGLTTPAVLGGQNLEIVGLYLDLDGSFPNHPPNPLEPANLVDAQAAVREHGADLAVVFDGDADRCFVIDERGEVVSPSAITGLIAVRELARDPGSAIVINKITSHSVPELVAAAGGRTVITRVGHTFVKAAMAEHDAVFGGEHSAHFYFRDFWGADTGMLAALHVLAAVGETDVPLSRLVEQYSLFAASGEINSTVAEVEPILLALEQHFGDRAVPDRVDGLTLTGDGWWVNVRPSNTEPLLRLNVEAPTAEQVEALRDEALAIIRA